VIDRQTRDFDILQPQLTEAQLSAAQGFAEHTPRLSREALS